MAVARIAESIVKDEHAVMPIVLLAGEYGLRDLCLSVPTIVGKNGAQKVLEIPLSEEEAAALHASAAQLGQVISGLDL